jgi:hypothetical protein
MTIGMAAISLMNIMWLQAAPTAFENISWKFYLCFIIPAYIFAIICWFFYPNTKGLALEEIAALFGDEVQTDIYQPQEEAIQKIQEHPHDKSSELPSTDAVHQEKV